MMLENHLRHVKPSEFNRSVIWAGRIGLLLLLLVAILVFLPFAAQQVQGASVGSSFTGSNQLYNTFSGYRYEPYARAKLSMHMAIVNKQSPLKSTLRPILSNQLEAVAPTVEKRNWHASYSKSE